MSRKGDYLIPFDSDGNQLHWASEIWSDVDWRENVVFEDTLVYVSYARGRSAAYFEFTSATTGKRLTMFLKEIDTILKKRSFVDGRVSGRWTFVKRGENYGIRLAD